MIPSLYNIGKVLKTIPCPFVLEWHRQKEDMCIVFSPDEYLHIHLNHNPLVTIHNRCNRYFFEHNLKAVDFQNLALKLQTILNAVSDEEFSKISNSYLIKTANNCLYLSDEYNYLHKFVDLSLEVLPNCFNSKLIEC